MVPVLNTYIFWQLGLRGEWWIFVFNLTPEMRIRIRRIRINSLDLDQKLGCIKCSVAEPVHFWPAPGIFFTGSGSYNK